MRTVENEAWQTLEVGDQGGQVRPQQAPVDDDRRQHAVVDLVAARAVALVLAVFLDPQRDHSQFDLLYDARTEAGRPQGLAAIGADVHAVIEDGLDLLRGERRAFVLGMADLAARRTWAAVVGQRRARRLDDVGGGRLGGGGGVFACRGQLLLQPLDGGLQLLHLRATVLEGSTEARQLPLQLPTTRTGGLGPFGHRAILQLAQLHGDLGP